jgi:hypothetical protein
MARQLSSLSPKFVLLAHAESRLTPRGAVHIGRITVPESKVSAARYALVGWISTEQNLAPLQVAGGYLPIEE